MQKIFLTGLLLLSVWLLPAQTETIRSVFFDLDKSELNAEARQTLDALSITLLSAPDYTVTIDAYTDNSGTEEYNKRLAEDRAESVQQYLSAKGLLSGKTTVKSWGERNLSYDNTTEANRRKNRRVDIAVAAIYFDDYAALQKRLTANSEQKIMIQPDREQQITAARGTVIAIPAQSFVFDDGSSPTGPIEITVKEAYAPSDWISFDLSTTSNGHVLQTGGMVYIDAQSGGKQLSMADGAAITVAIPAGKIDPGMELFYGKQTENGDLNWQPVGQKFRQTLKDPVVTLDIDPSLGARIMAMKVPEYVMPTAPVFSGDLPLRPRKPNAPRAPHPPQRPDWDNIRYMFGGRSGESMSRKGSKKAKKYYQNALEKYERDSLQYVALYKKYETKVADFEASKQRYIDEREKWEAALMDRIRVIMNFEQGRRLHNYSESLQIALKQIGKNIGKRPYYSNLEYAVISAADKNYETQFRENFMNQHSNRITVGNLYYKHIGFKIVEAPEFKYLFRRVWDEYPWDTLQNATTDILKNIGLKDISDSLKAEISEKRLLTAQSTAQAQGYMRSYVADVSQLGWINCDKFYNDPAEKVQLVVNESEEATLYVVCRDINSLLSFSRNGESTYTASGLPKGKTVSVIAIRVKDGKPEFAMQDVRAGETGALTMQYRSVNMKELREELKRLSI